MLYKPRRRELLNNASRFIDRLPIFVIAMLLISQNRCPPLERYDLVISWLDILVYA